MFPQSRPSSGAGHHQVGEIEGYLSPKHGAQPLPMGSTQPVIPEYINARTEPPPGFVPFAPVAHGNGNGYPRSPIYGGIPTHASASTRSSRDSTPPTPRQIYTTSPTPPAFVHPIPFAGASPGPAVLPSPPRDRRALGSGLGTPYHRSVNLGSDGGTPVSHTWDLPSSSAGGGGTLSSNGPVDSSYAKFNSTTYLDPAYFPPENEGEDEDEATRRNTVANANAGAVPIPPPSYQNKRW